MTPLDRSMGSGRRVSTSGGLKGAVYRLFRALAVIYALYATMRVTYQISQETQHGGSGYDIWGGADHHGGAGGAGGGGGVFEQVPGFDPVMLIQAAFGASIIPKETEVLPYFHQARKVPAKDDITIFTLLTLERGDMFQRLVAAHDGPISVTIHLLSRDLITEVEDLYSSHPLMAENVDLHLVISPHLREFNFYRNVARLFSRTNYVMQWDVDFARITDFRSRIRNDPALSGLLQKGNNAFVVPAFQYKRNEEPAKEKFPKTKEELLPLYRMGEGTIQMFYQHFPPGHGSSNYTKWVDADDIYIVEEWDHRYEPYVIFRRDTSPWCDTRFVGYGANKAACLFEMFISGINFWVMPHDFIMHQTHAYPEKARQIGFDYNRRLYDTYREEVCLRYLNYFAQSDDLETQRTENLYKECRKLSGFKKWEAQLVTE